MSRKKPVTMTVALPFHERSVGLFFRGCLELLLGSGCIWAALKIAAPPTVEQLAKAPGQLLSLKAMLPFSAVLYFLLGIAFIWLFVCSMRALRRLSTAPVSKSMATLPFCDQSIELKIFGILQIILGCVCLLAALGIVLSIIIPHRVRVPGHSLGLTAFITPGMFFFILLAVALVWFGVGSIRARRWAWSSTVILSWMWLIAGVIAMTAEVLFWQTVHDWIGSYHGKMSDMNILAIQIKHAIPMPAIYILLPIVFLMFYHRLPVRATCYWRDSQSRWTDRCPMPVLALSAALATSAVWIAWLVAYYCLKIPLVGSLPHSFDVLAAYHHVLSFGGVLGIAPGALVFILLVLVSGSLAWGTYRLKMTAWWGTLLYWGACTAFLVWTFSHLNMLDLHGKMFSLHSCQPYHLRQSDFDSLSFFWELLILVVAGAALCYLLLLLRYFIRGTETSNTLWSVDFDYGN